MKLTGQNYIGNRLSSSSMITFQSADPSTGIKGSTQFNEASSEEVNEAVKLADAAYQTYSNTSRADRANFLEAIADEILNLGDSLIDIATFETALPAGRITGERGRTMNQLKLFAKVVREGSWQDIRIDNALPDRTPFPRSDIRQIQMALGPAGIFGASNFPLAFSVAGGDTASALAAGCPVVVKGHPFHPGTSELVASAIVKAVDKCNMPNGTFSLVQGKSHAVGMQIVTHPLIKAIGFTGSNVGGKALFDAANSRPEPIPVYAEMGSVNPIFILPSALKNKKEQIQKGMANSLCMGVGQFCTNPGLIVTENSGDAKALINGIGEEVSQMAPGVMLAEGIKRGYQQGISRLKENDALEVLGVSKEAVGENAVKAYVFSTSAVEFAKNHTLGEEVFGPSTLHISAQNRRDLLDLAKNMTGHLTATIHGEAEELEEYKELVSILQTKVGRLIFNGYPTGVEVCDAMVHGGPFPSTTAASSTSVGTAAIKRFSRPICFQDFPQSALPVDLKNENPDSIYRKVDGEWNNGNV